MLNQVPRRRDAHLPPPADGPARPGALLHWAQPAAQERLHPYLVICCAPCLPGLCCTKALLAFAGKALHSAPPSPLCYQNNSFLSHWPVMPVCIFHLFCFPANPFPAPSQEQSIGGIQLQGCLTVFLQGLAFALTPARNTESSDTCKKPWLMLCQSC